MHHNADLGPDRSKTSFVAAPLTLFIIVHCYISYTVYTYKRSTVIIVGLCNLIVNGIVELSNKYKSIVKYTLSQRPKFALGRTFLVDHRVTRRDHLCITSRVEAAA